MLRIFSFLMLFSFVYASNSLADSKRNNFLGGVFQGQYSTPDNSNIIGTAVAEVGPRNYRASATGAIKLNENHGIKLTAEYLRQNIDYTFALGNTREWVQQTAVGAAYAFFPTDSWVRQYEASTYYSYAPSKDLSSISNGLQINDRRIAGSNAFGMKLGLVFKPWSTMHTKVSANYDNVVYDMRWGAGVSAKGLGGELDIHQTLFADVSLIGNASVRQPFNSYKLGVEKHLGKSNLAVGVEGVLVRGRYGLPNTQNVFVTLKYPSAKTELAHKFGNDFAQWAKRPAVYLPQVLAIADQRMRQEKSSSCGSIPPVFNGPVVDQRFPWDSGNIVVSTGSFFTGTNLTYSANISSISGPLSKMRIDSTTGDVIYNGDYPDPDNDVYQVIVTATDSCGNTAVSNQFNFEVTLV